MRIAGTVLSVLAVLAAIAGILARESAVAVVLDLNLVALAAAALAAVLAVLLLRSRSRYFAMVLIAASVAVFCIAGYERWLELDVAKVNATNGDVKISGILFLPKGRDHFPLAVMVHGANQPRSELEFYAKYLARRGIAAAAFDERGRGGSTGNNDTATYSDLGADAAAFLHTALENEHIDRAKAGYVGFSQAEWTIPAAAANDPAASFVVVVSASGMLPVDQVEAEMMHDLRGQHTNNQDIIEARAFYKRLSEYWRSGRDQEAMTKVFDDAKRKPWYKASNKFPVKLSPCRLQLVAQRDGFRCRAPVAKDARACTDRQGR